MPNAMLARTSRGFSFYTLKGIQTVRFCLDMILFISIDYKMFCQRLCNGLFLVVYSQAVHTKVTRLHYIKILVHHFNIPIQDMFIVLSMHCCYRDMTSEHNSDSWVTRFIEIPGKLLMPFPYYLKNKEFIAVVFWLCDTNRSCVMEGLSSPLLISVHGLLFYET